MRVETWYAPSQFSNVNCLRYVGVGRRAINSLNQRRIVRISLRAIDPLRYRPPRRVALHPNPRCNSLGQPMKHRANIAFRYAPILALTPFSLLVADTFAEALQGLPHTDCLGSKIGVEYASTKTARSGSFDLARTRNSSMHIPSRSICLPRTICVDGV
jgi:hypothetical protein